MHESGYYETAPSDSALEETVVIVSSGTFEIPVERDGTLLLSSIQIQLPFASGLWYWATDQQRKRAIKYDRISGKLHPPPHGWSDRTYYVSLRNVDNPHAGCVSGYGLDRYEKATRLFQDSVHSVSRLMGVEFLSSTSVTEQELLRQLKEENEKLNQALSVGHVSNTPIAERHALLELQEKCDVLVKELERKNQDLHEGEKNRHEIELKLSSALKHFEEAKKKVEQLETVVNDKDKEIMQQAESFNRKTSELEYQLADFQKQISVQSSAQDLGVFQMQPLQGARKSSEDEPDLFTQKITQLLQEKDDELAQKNAAMKNLETDLYDTQRQLEDIQQKYDHLILKVGTTSDATELAALRKLIDELKLKCSELELTVSLKNQEINYLQTKNQELESECQRLRDELQKFQARCQQLEETVHALHQYGLIMKKRADDAKWRCGELEHAFRTNNSGLYNSLLEKDMNDAKWRCGELESAVKNKSEEVNSLTATKNVLETKLKTAYQDLELTKSAFEEKNQQQEQDTVSRIDTLQHELKVVRKQLDSAQRKFDAKTPRKDERDQIIRELQEKLSYAENRYEQVQTELKTKMEADKENTKWKFYELESALSMMNKDLQEHQAKAAQREDELLNEIEERKQEIVELRERLQ